VGGVMEHTELLSHLLKDAKRSQRSITVAMLDLNNAFEEVHHDLIISALRYNHLPQEFTELIKNIYDNNYITVVADNVWTAPIKIERGVLQGDPASPLLFNMCFNTLMKTLDQPIYRKLGYSWGVNKINTQQNWIQFADDAMIIASDTKSAQGLINVFQAWCSWSSMHIRLDKCVTFGIMKRDNVYSQIQPALSITSGQITTTGFKEEFKYLGRSYSFDMSNTVPEQLLERKLSDLLVISNHLNIKAQTKLKILSQYSHSQILFKIKVYDFPITWVEPTLDAMSIRYIRDWLEMPISACPKETLTLPKSGCGMGVSSFKHIAQKMLVQKRYSMQHSTSPEIQQVWTDSSSKYIDADRLIV